MKGSIIGDIIGSAFIKNNKSSTEFQLFKPVSAFTNDTVLTLSTADAILHQKDFELAMKEWVQIYPKAGFDSCFKNWAVEENQEPYFGNGDGAARRISPIGFAASNLNEALEMAERATRITHNQKVKIDAAKAVVAAIYLAKNGANKNKINSYLAETFGYNLDKSLKELHHDVTNPNLSTPVPAAITVFLNSDNYEDAIRKAISIGGASNTIASITGGIAQAYFKHIPRSIIRRALSRITPEMQQLIDQFEHAHVSLKNDDKEICINLH